MKKTGFTLVELLIAMVVGLIIMAAVYSVMTMAQRTSAGTERKVLTQQDTRSVLDFMASEIRMASFNPSMAGTTWTNLTTTTNVNACANVNGLIGGAPTLTTAKRGILFADANNLFIAMDLGPLGTPNVYGMIGDDQNELIFYRYNSANGAITRSVS
ncbi:MAG: prepilin-type N-terminal cleavage/methylation domain-containing protein, partial [Smithellaceae bacterium]